MVAGWLYTLTGFFSPVDNLPTVNVASAGSSIPVKFSLAGNWGLNVFAPGSPASQPMTCGGGTVDDVEEISPPGSSQFSYDPVTDTLQVRLEDGAQLEEHLPAAGRPPP